MRTSAHGVRASDVFESSLLSSFKKLYQHNMLTMLEQLLGEPNKIISWVLCFDVSEPDVFIGFFFIYYYFYNSNSPPLVNEHFS